MSAVVTTMRVDGLDVRLVRDAAGWRDLDAAWRRLWHVTEPRPPMLEREWSVNWWRVFGDRGDLFTVQVERDGATIGIAPLYVRGRGGRSRELLRTLCFVGTGEPEHEEVTSENLGWLCAPDDVGAVTRCVVAALTSARGGWDALDLRYIGPGGTVAEELRGRLAPTLLESETRVHSCHGVEVRPFDDYVQAIESGSRRARYRKWMRRAAEAGVELVRAQGRDQALAMFESLAELHGRRWASKGGDGACSSERFRSFHRAMIEHYAASERLWVFGLRHADRWIALHYDIQAADTLYYYLSGLDAESAGKLAPGNVLLLHAIDLAAREGLSYLDLLAGSYDFKQQLATSARSTVTLTALNRNAVAWAWRMARDLRRRGA